MVILTGYYPNNPGFKPLGIIQEHVGYWASQKQNCWTIIPNQYLHRNRPRYKTLSYVIPYHTCSLDSSEYLDILKLIFKII